MKLFFLLNIAHFQNLTEYNTAHNRRISTLGITNDTAPYKKNTGLKRKRVTFNEDEIIINPEDVDPSIGRFRNLVQTTVIPTTSKKLKLDINSASSGFSMPSPPSDMHKNILHPTILSTSAYDNNLYAGLPPTSMDMEHSMHSLPSTSSPEELSMNPFGPKLGLFPNPAPEINVMESQPAPPPKTVQIHHSDEHADLDDEPRKKKKYAKEAWPKLARKTASFNIKTNLG